MLSIISKCVNRRKILALCFWAGLVPVPASAHAFGKLYTLPVPIWLYLYGAAAALLLSFLLIAYFITIPVDAGHGTSRLVSKASSLNMHGKFKWTLPRAMSVALLLLCISSGLFGTKDSYANFNMTFFWVVFLLGYTYFVALTGDSYDAINPLRSIIEALNTPKSGLFSGRYQYPEYLKYWPALAQYAVFIWIELFGKTQPHSLAIALIAYSVITMIASWLWGLSAWFRYGDCFSVFFRIIAMASPVERSEDKWTLRKPFRRTMNERCENISLLTFLVFMLSSTAFDGIHETVPWAQVYWKDLIALLQPFSSGDIVQTFPLYKKFYPLWQTTALLASAIIYLAIYLSVIVAVRWLARRREPIATLSLEFGYSLLPIALAYNIAHYFPLLISQGPRIIELASDPLGYGWNLFGTRHIFGPIIPDAGFVWHMQVALILVGHIASVYIAHLVALRFFGSPRTATLSQLPMLALMMVYTTTGLWILSMPIQSGIYTT